ncbi:hypothetical protein BC941DRAFT_435526 [Chlamydoabsidia padenii]|nr:hypothetical protein BC941DRAFT_435526 [Chlamydoabsidia padenii]
MNTIDFLSSDIEFPCDSNEPKLSASPCTKLPEPVDWSFHDYYSTILEKAFSPINNLTDIRPSEPVTQPPNYLKDWKHPSLFTVHDKQDDQAVVLVLGNAIQPPQQQQNNNNNLRAALRGALDLVENDMQKNMHESFKTPTTHRPFGNSSVYNKDHYLTWKDDILAETLHIGSLDQDLWDEDDEHDEMMIRRQDASPAYHAIDENPIIDSSLPSRISSIMPLSSSPQLTTTTIQHEHQQQLQVPVSRQEPEIEVPIISEPASPSPSLTSPPLSQSTRSGKSKQWNVWSKVKQATLPFTKQFKSPSSSKKVFKRLFQH